MIVAGSFECHWTGATRKKGGTRRDCFWTGQGGYRKWEIQFPIKFQRIMIASSYRPVFTSSFCQGHDSMGTTTGKGLSPPICSRISWSEYLPIILCNSLLVNRSCSRFFTSSDHYDTGQRDCPLLHPDWLFPGWGCTLFSNKLHLNMCLFIKILLNKNNHGFN